MAGGPPGRQYRQPRWDGRGITTSRVSAPAVLERPAVVDVSDLLPVWDRCQYPDLGSFGVEYSDVCQVARRLCTDSLSDP